MNGEVDKDLGRFYYLTNLKKEGVLPSLIKKTKEGYKIMEGKLKEGENLDIEMNYISIAPQFTVSYVVNKDCPIKDSLHLIFEPYTSKDVVDDEIKFGFDLNIIDCLINDSVFSWSEPTVNPFVYDKQSKEELLERIKNENLELRGYCNAYYIDNEASIRNKVFGEYASAYKLVKDISPRNASLEFRRDMEGKFKSAITSIVAKMLKLYLTNPTAVEKLQNFIENRKIDNLDNEKYGFLLDALINIDLPQSLLRAKDDPVFLETLTMFQYTLKTDIKKLKNDNKLYNIVMLKDVMTSKVYIVMFKRKPIEYQTPQESGFNTQEMGKLLSL